MVRSYQTTCYKVVSLGKEQYMNRPKVKGQIPNTTKNTFLRKNPETNLVSQPTSVMTPSKLNSLDVEFGFL